MTDAAWVLLALAGAVAAADWWAVAHRPAPVENVLKPLVMVLLVAVALVLDPVDGGQRAWFVAALVLSLAGDVFLLPAVDRFVLGLASFLLAHVAYAVGFLAAGREATPYLDLAVFAVLAVVAHRVVSGVRRTEPALVVPVGVYIAVISAMFVAAVWHGDAAGRGGAGLFVVSDSILALDRFDRHRPWMPTAVMVTYHVAQALLAVSLAR